MGVSSFQNWVVKERIRGWSEPATPLPKHSILGSEIEYNSCNKNVSLLIVGLSNTYIWARNFEQTCN